MKIKLLLTGLLLTLITFSGKTQSTYVGFSGGFALPMGHSVMGTQRVDNDLNNLYGTYGNGWQVGIQIGWRLNEHLGFEIGLNRFQGLSRTTDAVRLENLATDLRTVTASNQLRLTPSVLLSTGHEKLNFYGRIGAIVAVGGKRTLTTTGFEIGKEIRSVSDARDRISAGISGALGLSYSWKNLTFFGEVEAIGLSVKTQSNELISHMVNGNNELEQLSTYMKNTNAVDALDSESNNFAHNIDTDENNPKDILATYLPYHSIGFNLGIRFNF